MADNHHQHNNSMPLRLMLDASDADALQGGGSSLNPATGGATGADDASASTHTHPHSSPSITRVTGRLMVHIDEDDDDDDEEASSTTTSSGDDEELDRPLVLRATARDTRRIAAMAATGLTASQIAAESSARSDSEVASPGFVLAPPPPRSASNNDNNNIGNNVVLSAPTVTEDDGLSPLQNGGVVVAPSAAAAVAADADAGYLSDDLSPRTGGIGSPLQKEAQEQQQAQQETTVTRTQGSAFNVFDATTRAVVPESDATSTSNTTGQHHQHEDDELSPIPLHMRRSPPLPVVRRTPDGGSRSGFRPGEEEDGDEQQPNEKINNNADDDSSDSEKQESGEVASRPQSRNRSLAAVRSVGTPIGSAAKIAPITTTTVAMEHEQPRRADDDEDEVKNGENDDHDVEELDTPTHLRLGQQQQQQEQQQSAPAITSAPQQRTSKQLLRTFRVGAWTVRAALRWTVATLLPGNVAHPDRNWKAVAQFLHSHWHTPAARFILRKLSSGTFAACQLRDHTRCDRITPQQCAGFFFNSRTADKECQLLCNAMLLAVAQKRSAMRLSNTMQNNNSSRERYSDVLDFLAGLKKLMLIANENSNKKSGTAATAGESFVFQFQSRIPEALSNLLCTATPEERTVLTAPIFDLLMTQCRLAHGRELLAFIEQRRDQSPPYFAAITVRLSAKIEGEAREIIEGIQAMQTRRRQHRNSNNNMSNTATGIFTHRLGLATKAKAARQLMEHSMLWARFVISSVTDADRALRNHGTKLRNIDDITRALVPLLSTVVELEVVASSSSSSASVDDDGDYQHADLTLGRETIARLLDFCCGFFRVAAYILPQIIQQWQDNSSSGSEFLDNLLVSCLATASAPSPDDDDGDTTGGLQQPQLSQQMSLEATVSSGAATGRPRPALTDALRIVANAAVTNLRSSANNNNQNNNKKPLSLFDFVSGAVSSSVRLRQPRALCHIFDYLQTSDDGMRSVEQREDDFAALLVRCLAELRGNSSRVQEQDGDNNDVDNEPLQAETISQQLLVSAQRWGCVAAICDLLLWDDALINAATFSACVSLLNQLNNTTSSNSNSSTPRNIRAASGLVGVCRCWVQRGGDECSKAFVPLMVCLERAASSVVAAGDNNSSNDDPVKTLISLAVDALVGIPEEARYAAVSSFAALPISASALYSLCNTTPANFRAMCLDVLPSSDPLLADVFISLLGSVAVSANTAATDATKNNCETILSVLQQQAGKLSAGQTARLAMVAWKVSSTTGNGESRPVDPLEIVRLIAETQNSSSSSNQEARRIVEKHSNGNDEDELTTDLCQLVLMSGGENLVVQSSRQQSAPQPTTESVTAAVPTIDLQLLSNFLSQLEERHRSEIEAESEEQLSFLAAQAQHEKQQHQQRHEESRAAATASSLLAVEQQEEFQRSTLSEVAEATLTSFLDLAQTTMPRNESADKKIAQQHQQLLQSLLDRQLVFLQQLEEHNRSEIDRNEASLLNKSKAVERAHRDAIFTKIRAESNADVVTRDLQHRLNILEEERRHLAETKRNADAGRTLHEKELSRETAPLRTQITMLQEQLRDANLRVERERSLRKKEQAAAARAHQDLEQQLSATQDKLQEAKKRELANEVKAKEMDKRFIEAERQVQRLRNDLEAGAASQSLKQWCHDATTEMLEQSRRAQLAETNFKIAAAQSHSLLEQFTELAAVLRRLESEVELLLEGQKIVSIAHLDTTQLQPLIRDARAGLSRAEEEGAMLERHEQQQEQEQHQSKQHQAPRSLPAPTPPPAKRGGGTAANSSGSRLLEGRPRHYYNTSNVDQQDKVRSVVRQISFERTRQELLLAAEQQQHNGHGAGGAASAPASPSKHTASTSRVAAAYAGAAESSSSPPQARIARPSSAVSLSPAVSCSARNRGSPPAPLEDSDLQKIHRVAVVRGKARAPSSSGGSDTSSSYHRRNPNSAMELSARQRRMLTNPIPVIGPFSEHSRSPGWKPRPAKNTAWEQIT